MNTVKGKINPKFAQSAKDYHFKTRPCIAGRPWSKRKVENLMKALDELFAYNGKLDYNGLHMKLKEVNERMNSSIHSTIGKTPILPIQKEKDFLTELPGTKIRNLSIIPMTSVKVDRQSMINHKGNKYSVEPRYIGKRLDLQAYDGYPHLYDNTELVALHPITNKRMELSGRTLYGHEATKARRSRN